MTSRYNGTETRKTFKEKEKKMDIRGNEQLEFHLQQLLQGNRRFENAAQAVSRMILEKGVERISRGGSTAYDFKFFRQGSRHVVCWYDELNDLVNFVQDAAEGGPSGKMAFVFVGEPGNGKTNTITYLSDKYRRFLEVPGNRRYTFEFVNLDALGTYGNLHAIPSQTFEDPAILAMNLLGSMDEGREYLAKAGFDDKTVEKLFVNYRPLGACSEYIWDDIRTHCDGDLEKMLKFVRVVPVRISESSGTVTGKYSAKDKITSSADDLLGESDSLPRILNLVADTAHPYRNDVRKGALARVGGGGIHFSDELFRNKPDLVQVYLQVIENRNIELNGYRWPIDVLILATSNNDVYNRFTADKEESPVKDRCKACYVSHNTDYKAQAELTRYAFGGGRRLTHEGEDIHTDPNLEYALSVAVVFTRLVHSDKLSPVDMMKLEAGEVAGDKSVKTLVEIKTALNANPDVTKRWGQKGIGHRGLGRVIENIVKMPETHEGRCMLALDCFKAAEREVLDFMAESVDRDKCLKDLKEAKKLYRQRVKTSIFNAFRDDPEAIGKDVMAYVNMIIGIDSDQLGPEKMWRYHDPRDPHGETRAIKIDERFIKSVEARLGLSTEERTQTFRTTIRKIYGQKVGGGDRNYDFMDQEDLVKAVTEVKLESDVAGASSLVGALANRTNEENVRIYNRMVETMMGPLHYCHTCAEKTIEYFCSKEDES